MPRAVSRTGLRRTGLTVLLIVIYISGGIRITVACSARICKQAAKTVSNVMLQTHVHIFHPENTVPRASVTLQKMDLCP